MRNDGSWPTVAVSEQPAAVTLHLVPEEVWLAQKDGIPLPAGWVRREGFIHCTHGHDFVIEVGNRYYRDDPRPYLVLEVDLERVAAPVVYEDDERRFPHIYGQLERHAVRRICRDRTGGGRDVRRDRPTGARTISR